MVASNIGFFGKLASVELESLLCDAAAMLPTSDSVPFGRKKVRFLHIFDEAYNLFGHTALCVKWMRLSGDRAQHSAILISQSGNVPKRSEAVAFHSKGRVITLDRFARILLKIGQLF